MAISIIGRKFNSAEAYYYSENTAVRAPAREAGATIEERNRLAKEREATRLGLVAGPANVTNQAASESLPRVMYIIAPPGYEYRMSFSPSSFNVEGFGAELSEIPRPYNIPLVDIKGGKNRRVSFEFVVARHLDGFYSSVEEEIKQIQLIADMGMPIGFDNINAILRENYWFIDNISFNYTRDNVSGETVAAQCNISLIEYTPLRSSFILLPRFRYGKFPARRKKEDKNNRGGVNDPDYWRRKMAENKVQRERMWRAT